MSKTSAADRKKNAEARREALEASAEADGEFYSAIEEILEDIDSEPVERVLTNLAFVNNAAKALPQYAHLALHTTAALTGLKAFLANLPTRPEVFEEADLADIPQGE